MVPGWSLPFFAAKHQTLNNQNLIPIQGRVFNNFREYKKVKIMVVFPVLFFNDLKTNIL